MLAAKIRFQDTPNLAEGKEEVFFKKSPVSKLDSAYSWHIYF